MNVKELLAAYEKTCFVVRPTAPGVVGAPPERFELYVGKFNPAFDAWTKSVGLSCWTLITAYNPGLVRPGDAANEAANLRLAERRKERGYRFVPAEGVGESGWTEPSFFVWHMTEKKGRALGLEFGQWAVVCGSPGCEPELVFCVDRNTLEG